MSPVDGATAAAPTKEVLSVQYLLYIMGITLNVSFVIYNYISTWHTEDTAAHVCNWASSAAAVF